MEAHASHEISQHWSPGTIVLSYAIAVTGSYCTIQLMEQWRSQENRWHKLILLWLSAVALGGCGIWCMHFTGMHALQMTLNDGTILEVNFEGGTTILSLIAPIVGVFLGLRIASTDPFFLEVEASRRKDLLTKDLKGISMETMIKNKNQVGTKIKFIALFSRLWRIIFGGFFAALGVLAMHYLGMMAQRTNAEMHFHAGIIALSSIIAFATANAAFWILFRALTFWPGFESLRMGSALIMGVAVCGTHYSGMGAATYTYAQENYSQSIRFLLKGGEASTVASHIALLVCYWFSTFAVVVSLRKEIRNSQMSSRHHTTMNKSQAAKAAKAPGPNQAQSGRFSEAPASKGQSMKGPAFNAVMPAPSEGPTSKTLKGV